MIDTTIRKLAEHAGARVRLKGWLYNRRSKGKIHFLLIRDGSGIVQGVATKQDVPEAVFAAMDRIPQEASIVVEGTVRKDERAPGGVELTLHTCDVVQAPTTDYPIAKQEHGPDFLLQNRHLWLRSRKQHAVMRIRSRVEMAIREYFDRHGFTLVDAPVFTPSACEGTTTLFEVNYFDEGKAYLTQSGQLYMEAAAMALGKIYVFGPTFRAEKSKTRRHLTEFWMVEPEMAFADLEADMALAEDFLESVVQRVLARRERELRVLERDLDRLARIRKPFPRLSYTEAVTRLQQKGFAIAWGDDLGADEETALSEEFDRPLMVHRYPRANKAFYMKADPDDPRLALCVDVLAPEGYGEVIGGGQREDDLATLEQRIVDHQLPREAFDWYLDLRRFGSVPHAGFGMGIERCVAWLCGIRHVRETIPFPRLLERLRP